MRLLNVRSLEFGEFPFADAPSYVIASHTWIPDGEITCEEFQHGKGRGKAGYQKVIGFTDCVKKYTPDVEWVWIDTVCIDQSDGEEVTKAVNSMFRWYIHAIVCLAYLPDVQTNRDIRGFANSRWFRRGWTLQELLASRAVVFLDQDWHVIGHKADSVYGRKQPLFDMGTSLNASIAKFTNVPQAVLENFYHSRYLSTEERLGWMDGRETTKPEDKSYSLMGIFDINIPTNYGEGEAEARRRLLAKFIQNKAILDRLPATPGAAFNSSDNEVVSECLQNTRVDLLRDVGDWADSADSACIFWLSGMAGTGKSTVLKTVAQTFEDQHRLAASFCFRRGEADRERVSRLIATISGQLAERLPDVSDGVISALETDPDIVRRTLKEQFENLILQPLQRFASPPVYGPAWVMCIDALDECDNELDVKVVVDLLATLQTLRSANFRFFITSRPDLPLRLGFGSISKDAHVDIHLEDISEDVIAHDIAAYFEHRLSEIRSNHARLNELHPVNRDWPGEDAVQALVQMAQPLFIFAATICRLLAEPNEDPHETMRIVLQHRHRSSLLDRTYQPVLDRLLVSETNQQQKRITEEFRIVVGCIIMLAEPLTIAALSRLLELSEEDVSARLQRLHSVLHVPLAQEDSGLVRPLHLSFRDYLTNPDTREKTPFWIDEAQQHRILTGQCLRLLSEHGTLQEDLFHAGKPGMRKTEINRLQIENAITSDVAYSCSYWPLHFIRSKQKLLDDGPVHDFLQQHFLHWLEVLSWLGKLSSVTAYISDLLLIAQDSNSVRVSEFLHDAKRFMLQNRYVIDIAPLQIYHSAVNFSPSQSIIRQTFYGQSPQIWACLPRVPKKWSAEIQKLEGHDDDVNAVAFLTNGQVIASASDDRTLRLWNTATGEQMQKLEGHDDNVNAVAFSPDGQIIASASSDRTLRLWNVATGVQMQKLEGHDENVNSVAFSPDGQIIASASDDETVRLWNVGTGEQMQKLEGHEGSVNAVAFSPDGQVIASASDDETVRLWHAAAREQTHKLQESDYDNRAVASSADEQILVSASNNRTIQKWNTAIDQERQKLEGHDDRVNAVAFSPDGQVVASASNDQTVRLWDTVTGEQIQELDGHDGRIWAVAFSPDGLIVASASGDQTVRLWNAATGEQMQKLEGHVHEVWAIAFSPDRETIASASWDNTVRLWNVATGEQTQKLEGHDDWVWAISFSPDGQFIASASRDQTVRLWTVATGEQIRNLEGHDDFVNAIAFSPDGQVIASASDDETVQLWSTDTGEQVKRLEGHDNGVNAVAFSLDGQIVASASRDRTVRLWNTVTGEQIHKLEGHGDEVRTIAFSPDGQVIASASEDKTVRLWNSATGEQIQSLEGHDKFVNAIAFSPNGQVIASASNDKTVRLWNVTTNKQTQKFQGHDNRVTAVAFSPDGQVVASASEDETVRLWSTTTGEQMQKLGGHDGRVYGVTFSPDGQTITSASDDRTVRLWNVTTGKQTKRLEGHDDDVNAVAFSPDGQVIVSVSDDRTVRLWNAAMKEPKQKVKGHDGRVTTVAFSPGGQAVASTSWDKIVRVWNVATGKQTKKLEGHESHVNAVAFSPDGQIIASASHDQTVRLWSVATGEQLQHSVRHSSSVAIVIFSPDGQFIASASISGRVSLCNVTSGKQTWFGHTSNIGALAYSADGEVLASGSSDRIVRLWSVATGRTMKKLEGHEDFIDAVAFSPDEQIIASASRDQTVRLWDPTTGEQMQKLEGHTGWIWAVAFSPNGQVVASASGDHTVRLWDVATGRMTQLITDVTTSSNIVFSADGRSVQTDTGMFLVDSAVSSSRADTLPRTTSLELRTHWLRNRGEDLLWLPLDYRGSCSAIHEQTLVVGQASGAVSFFRLK